MAIWITPPAQADRMAAMKLSSLSGKAAWVILIGALLLSVAAAGMLLRSEVRDLARDHQTLATNLVLQLAHSGHLALLANNEAALRPIARSILQTAPIVGQVTVYNSADGSAVQASRDPPPATQLQTRLAALARAVTTASLPLKYSTPIPVPGAGTTLAPFGTPRAGIGTARVTLSSLQWTRELANATLRASLLGLSLFTGLLLTTLLVAWIGGRPLSRVGARIRDITGSDQPATETEIETSLTAIGERLMRSEARAQRASNALRNREITLDRARQQARDATRLRTDMLAGISHELRTPLVAILGQADTLSDSKLDHEQHTQVALIHNSTRHLLGLLDSVLEWSGVDRHRGAIDEVGFNIADTIEETITLLAPMAYEKNLELAHLVYQDVPARLRGDPLRFQQVLTNLVSNAIKFTDHGSVVVRAMLEQETEELVQVRVSVRDTGSGISSNDQSRLFNIYERLENAANRAGTGMGLAISKHLLELMGGSIDIDSQPGAGSEFHFTLPLRKALQDEGETRVGSDLTGRCLWLMEPFEPSRHALKHRFETWRTTVIELDSEAALRTALAACGGDLPPPDAIIMAVPANPVEALPLRRLLQEHAGRPPCITLVSSNDRGIHQQLERAGATRSMPKFTPQLRFYRELCAALGITHSPARANDAALEDIQALIAEDNPAGQRYLRAQLTELGARVAVVGSGDEAVSAWQKGAFPLVLADDRMPGLDGPGVFRRIRTMAGASAQPILIGISADPTADARRRFLDAGADACLIKPFDTGEILQRVRPLLKTALAPAPATPAPDLTTDPELVALLAQELPKQLAAVEAALTKHDYQLARDCIHTLHGTAAFYRLATLKDAAAHTEQLLAHGHPPDANAIDALRRATRATQQLFPAPQQRVDNRSGTTSAGDEG